MDTHFDMYVQDQRFLLKECFNSIKHLRSHVTVRLQDPIIEKADKDAISYYKAIVSDCKKMGLNVDDFIDLLDPVLIITSANSDTEIPSIAKIADVDNLFYNLYESPIGQGICDYLSTLTNLRESTVTVIGRGKRAGKPIIDSLLKRGATVICCNSTTNKFNLDTYARNSNILITAANKPEIFDSHSMLPYKKGIIVDCGCCWSDQKQKLVGNMKEEILVEFESDKDQCKEVIRFLRGTGILTRIGLLKNIYRSMLIDITGNYEYSEFNDWYHPIEL